MARLYDTNGQLLGGLQSARIPYSTVLDPEAAPKARLNPCYGAEETVPGLGCSYGSLAYCYGRDHQTGPHGASRLPACHNPVEDPEERHYCSFCGGSYCTVHAEQAMHDCENVILSH
jgi:hypothetical protein